ncbi:MAG: glycoside hydrolase family 127 protein [Candidatus Omnitrophica bacterium]|nr:glycoside hydrolase family 127 protein [Candidatus Omnitrophota bacterium]
MNELEILKQKIKEIFEILKSVVKSRVEGILKQINPFEVQRIELKAIIVLFAICLVIGFFSGFTLTAVNTKLMSKVTNSSSLKNFSLINYLFGKSIPFSGLQSDGSFVLANFEKSSDFGMWKRIKSKVEPSPNILEGSASAKVTLYGGGEFSGMTIDELVRSRIKITDWSVFDRLQFQIFNPNEQPLSLSILVTDLWGQKFQRDVTIQPHVRELISVLTSDISGAINIHKIDQLSIVRWSTPSDVEFLIDDMLLTPASFPQGASGQTFFDYGFAKRKPYWMYFDQQTNQGVIRAPFIVRNETYAPCLLCPVEGGIPFPLGELRDVTNVRVQNAQGEDVPFQSRILGRWPDGSIKWLSVHFQATVDPMGGAGYYLDYGPGIKTLEFPTKLKVTENAESIQINTGVLETVLSKKNFYLFDAVRFDKNGDGILESNEEVVSKAPLTVTFRGKEFRADLDDQTYQVEIEESGSQKVVIKASGWFESTDHDRYCQAIVRYYFYQGRSYVKVSHTFIYTGYPENKQFSEYRNFKLPVNETIESFGIKLPYHFLQEKNERVLIGQSQNPPQRLLIGNKIRLVQSDWKKAELTRDSEIIPSNDSYAGWVDISGTSKGIALAVRNFRENFPKAFEINRTKEKITVDLWPKEAGELDLSTSPDALGPEDFARGNAFGLSKTHDLLFYFHGLSQNEWDQPHNLLVAFMKPLLIRANPYWMDATGALGRLYPADQRYGTEEKMLERLFDWAQHQPRSFEWYGMLHFGDTMTWWRDEDGDEKGGRQYDQPGWHPVGRWGWYNCEGSQVGAMHRHSANHWSGRTDEASHTSVVGILLYYYLTGNERAFDVAKEIGDYFLTEPFTYQKYPHIAPNRAMSNVLWGDVLLYEATGDERFKKQADKIVKIFLRGQQQDGSFLENYNPIFHTWSGEKSDLYMSGYLVGALISYHELTQDSEVKEMLLRLIRYLAPSEYMGPSILHGLAYAYLITHDHFFISAAEQHLKHLMNHQQFSQDPLIDGLIYGKPIYHRPMQLLSTVPYVFGALEEKFAMEPPPS